MNVIEIKKNCDNCVKKEVCKFFHAYKELVTNNMFYSMFEYAEWNNLEKLFKDNAAKCKHYYPLSEEGKLELAKVDNGIFYLAVKAYVGSNLESVSPNRDIKKYIITTKDKTIITAEEIENAFTIKFI